jgi:hypothetical protein
MEGPEEKRETRRGGTICIIAADVRPGDRSPRGPSGAVGPG